MRLTPYHFRDQQMREVDIVLERDDGIIVGIEVKASATVRSSDFGGLRTLADACGDRFAYGIVLYDSTDLVPFGRLTFCRSTFGALSVCFRRIIFSILASLRSDYALI